MSNQNHNLELGTSLLHSTTGCTINTTQVASQESTPKMREVTIDNFVSIYPEIEKSLRNSKLIAIDTEFSALNPLGFQHNR